jgi:hypothetical protein
MRGLFCLEDCVKLKGMKFEPYPILVRIVFGFSLICLPLASAQAEIPQQNTYKIGQLWECSVPHEKAPPTERLQFFVTGQSPKRELSPRENFQTDDVIISVALFDRDPQACQRVRAFRHIGFDRSALDKCVPRLLPDEAAREIVPDEVRQRLDFARLSWLHRMQAKKDVIVSLSPSRLVRLLRRKRCGR